MGWLAASLLFFMVSIFQLVDAIYLKDSKYAVGFVFALLLGSLLLLMYFLWRRWRGKRKKKQAAKPENPPIPSTSCQETPLAWAGLQHVSGLPVGEGAPCLVYLFPDRFVFTKDTQTIILPMEKVRDVTIRTERELQTAYVSSAGGAVAGGLLFGIAGALYGGRVQKKETATYQAYFVVTYDKDDGVQYLIFGGALGGRPAALLKAYKKLPKEEQYVVL